MRDAVEALFAKETFTPDDRRLLESFLDLLERGEARAAEPDDGGWRVNAWVKKGILAGFRMGVLTDQSAGGFPFFDKDTYPLKRLTLESRVRVVPGGSAIRRGSYVAAGVTCMPPMYVNVGAWVDEGTMIDSHALVGSCAQVGKRVHLSAAAQLGGVLEPVGATPVVVEDDVLVGGNCGVYEGTRVGRRAVLGSGVILTRSTPIFDLVRERVIRAADGESLTVPEYAVVVPGSRAVSSEYGRSQGVQLYTPVIVKYRDEGTDRGVRLEQWLR